MKYRERRKNEDSTFHIYSHTHTHLKKSKSETKTNNCVLRKTKIKGVRSTKTFVSSSPTQLKDHD